MPAPNSWSDAIAIDPSSQTNVDALLGEMRWASTSISYSFPGINASWSTNADTGYGPVTIDQEPLSPYYQPLSASDRGFFNTAIQAWADVADLHFSLVADTASNVGDIRAAYTWLQGLDDAQAWAYLPDVTAYAGDVWFNAFGTSASRAWTPGSYEYLTVLHEIGHSLGLKHSFEGDHVLPLSLESMSFTVMSYSAQGGVQSTGFNFYPTTPMILDIAAIQYLYGANLSHNAGNNTYAYSDAIHYHQTIWDTGGTDTIQYSGSLSANIDLREGVTYGSRIGQSVFVTSAGGAHLQAVNNVWIADGAVIENATGGSGADTLTGNDADNSMDGGGGSDRIDGGAGNDTLTGGAGADSLTGGAGNDSMAGGAGNDFFFVDAVGDAVFENANEGTDTVASAVSFTLGANVENLDFGGLANVNGTGNNLDNAINGNSGDNSLEGGGGGDTLTGAAGDDTLAGGAGNDLYMSVSADDMILENADEGIDTVQSSFGYTLAANLENLYATGAGGSFSGNSLDNVITSISISTTGKLFDGGAGNDTLTGGPGADTLIGGTGNDSILGGFGNAAGDYFDGGAGIDTVSYEGNALGETASLVTGLATGNAGNDTLVNIENLTGGAGDDTLTGDGGDNVIDGDAGNDKLAGGAGNDSYVVDSPFDLVTENAGEGTDAVQSSVNYSLGANVENLTLSGSSNINGTGNALDNAITGNAADNLLDGGVGNDTLAGGAGNDTYAGIGAGDVVTENADEGIDTVQSPVSYSLGANLENLNLTGTAGLHGTGNDLDNAIRGSVGNDVLDGGAGNDSLFGGVGDDTLDGGAGNDTMFGSQGNDQYFVDSAGDVIVEAGLPQTGIDTVFASVSYTIGGLSVKNLVLEEGFGNINGTGNGLDNALTGNSGDNVLAGAAGNDTLDGGLGKDTLDGGAGNDRYVVDNAGDVIVDASGFDAVQSSVGYVLGASLENLTLTGVANINGAGNALANLITGNAGDNVLDGGAGADTLVGGAGNDSYVIDSPGDVVLELPGQGSDTVEISVGFTLGANLENILLSGAADINGTGNGVDNVLTGNSGANVLDGGAGADTLAGGAGDDTYIVDNAGDVVTEFSGQGRDTIVTPFETVLSTPFENLFLSGTGNVNATGNAANNVLHGNVGNNVLDGGTGMDTMDGGAGNDTYVIDRLLEQGVISDSGGVDTVISGAQYTGLASGLENLTLTGNAWYGVGNDGANAIVGTSGANVLQGGAGNDTLSGGGGADVLIGGDGADRFVFDTPLAAGNIDVVIDFSATANDRIVLDNDVFGALATLGTLAPAGFFAAAGAHEAANASEHIVLDTTSGALYYDADGAGGAAAVQIALIIGTAGITAANFEVIE